MKSVWILERMGVIIGMFATKERAIAEVQKINDVVTSKWERFGDCIWARGNEWLTLGEREVKQ